MDEPIGQPGQVYAARADGTVGWVDPPPRTDAAALARLPADPRVQAFYRTMRSAGLSVAEAFSEALDVWEQEIPHE